MKPPIAHAAALVLCVLVVWSAGSAGAQTTQPVPTSVPTVKLADPAFGFELDLPAGWDYDRTRFQQFKDSIGLLRGRSPDGNRGLQVMVFRSIPMKPFEEWIADFGRASAELTNSPRVDWEPWKLPPRAGAILSYSSKLGAATTRSHYLCVPFDPSTVWVLIYTGTVRRPDEDAQIRQEFDHVAASLHVYYDPQAVERLAPALDRGKALIERLRTHASRVQLDEEEYAYDMAIGGKSVGYVLRRITREEYVFSSPTAKRRYAKEGVRVRERSWRFADDGTAWHVRLDLFSSFDLRSELSENQQTQIPPPDAQPQELLVRTDSVVREEDVLFSSFTTNRDRALPDPGKPISVGPVYLDQAWVRLLPGLLLGNSDEQHAFAVYNPEVRALISHTIQPLGPKPLAGYDGTAYAFEVRDGFVDRPSVCYCDERGSLLRLEAGEVTLTRAPRAEIEKKYAARRDEARKRFGMGED